MDKLTKLAKLSSVSFSYADLFAGIGGFHAALGALGGECWFASEIDRSAKRVYEYNWRCAPGVEPKQQAWVEGDIVPLTENRMLVPPTDVLAAGFPCQPFSKSGYQQGMSEARGTLFWNICRVLEEHHPAVVLLENVRNLAGPRHRHEWDVIVTSLRQLGYQLSSTPAVFSPHLLPRELGGRPQVRERVFITATYVGDERTKSGQRLANIDVEPIVAPRAVGDWNPAEWSLATDLPLQADDEIEHLERYRLTSAEQRWIEVWDDLIEHLADQLDGARLPGFPIWADHFVHPDRLQVPRATAAWKADFLRKNAAFYERYQGVIDEWLTRHNHLEGIPASRRKLEWQAQDTASLWDTVMHFRPSGIRAKRQTYLPALVAITQTSIVGADRDSKRRITPREAARLQGLPDSFQFRYIADGAEIDQPDAASYKQMGNGVNVGAAYYVLRQHVLRDADLIAKRAQHLVDAVTTAPADPDVALTQVDSETSPLSVGAQRGSGRSVPQQSRQPQAETLREEVAVGRK